MSRAEYGMPVSVEGIDYERLGTTFANTVRDYIAEFGITGQVWVGVTIKDVEP